MNGEGHTSNKTGDSRNVRISGFHDCTRNIIRQVFGAYVSTDYTETEASAAPRFVMLRRRTKIMGMGLEKSRHHKHSWTCELAFNRSYLEG